MGGVLVLLRSLSSPAERCAQQCPRVGRIGERVWCVPIAPHARRRLEERKEKQTFRTSTVHP